MRASITCAIAALMLALPLATANAQQASGGGGGDGRGYDDITGPYVKLGLDLGWANFNRQFVPVNTTALTSGTAVGLAVAAGNRFSSWMAGDVELFYVGGADIRDPINQGFVVTQGSTIGMTFNGRVYPLGFFRDAMDGMQWLQPYAAIGLGVGFSENAAPGVFGSTNENQFLARFGGGVDVYFTQKWGVYMDGAYYVAAKDVFKGLGSLQFGAIYRF